MQRLGLKDRQENKTGASNRCGGLLEKLWVEHPVPKLLLEYRSLVKLKNTYLDISPSSEPQTAASTVRFNQTAIRNRRLSMSDPTSRTSRSARTRPADPPGIRAGRREIPPPPPPPSATCCLPPTQPIELRMLAHFHA